MNMRYFFIFLLSVPDQSMSQYFHLKQFTNLLSSHFVKKGWFNYLAPKLFARENLIAYCLNCIFRSNGLSSHWSFSLGYLFAGILLSVTRYSFRFRIKKKGVCVELVTAMFNILSCKEMHAIPRNLDLWFSFWKPIELKIFKRWSHDLGEKVWQEIRKSDQQQ